MACVPLAFRHCIAGGCGFFGREERPIWRTQAENACFARNLVTPSATIVPSQEIDGPGICGMTRPLKVSALANGTIAVDKVLTIDCPMIPALEAWLNDIVEPDAQSRFGQKVRTVNVFGAYSCRGIDNIAGAQLSEHAFGNAVDVAGFTLADGREIDFVHDWKKADGQEGAFLHEAHAGACQYFNTVLGTGRGRVPLQPYPSGPRQSRLDQHRPPPHLQADARAQPSAGAAGARRSAACAQHRRAARHRAFERARRRRLGRASDGPDGALPPAPIGETDPMAPVLPAGAGRSVDMEPTSSIAAHDY